MSKKQTPSVSRRKYDEDFKEEAVRLATSGNRTVADVARSLGISENLLYRWKRDEKSSSLHGITVSTEEHEPLRRVEQEREILKKALAIDLTVVYKLVTELSSQHPIQLICDTLGISRSAYCAYQQGRGHQVSEEKKISL